jgi:prepilin-type processing-associated H-X9-DG protein
MTIADSRTTQGVKTYGFNRGAFQMSDPVLLSGRDVPKMDPKVIFILDYPKLQADMTDIGDTLGERLYFDLIFIDPAPPTDPPPAGTLPWTSPPGLGGWSWESVQALRHFGKANVLFCDGHIESMDKDELLLSKHKDLWNCKGK